MGLDLPHIGNEALQVPSGLHTTLVSPLADVPRAQLTVATVSLPLVTKVMFPS